MKKALINLSALALICAVGWVIYSNSLHGQFQFDDMGYVARNDSIRDITNIKAIWNALSHPSRFVGFLTFAANFHFSRSDVFGYHVTNVIIHLFVGITVWWFVRILFQTPRIVNLNGVSKDVYEARDWIAFFVAFMFVAHPVETQAVAYIAQRLASMATLFYILTLCLYIKGRLTQIQWHKLVFFGLAFVTTILGMFTKQITFTLPFMVILMEIMFLNKEGRISWIKRLIKPQYVALFVGLLLIIPWMFNFNPKSVFKTNIASGSHLGDTINPVNYFLTQMEVVPHYIRLLFIPIGQNLDYDWPVSTTLLDPGVIFGILFLSGLIALGFYSYKRNVLVSFGIFWFFITASIESSFIPIRHVIFEHRVYLPSFGCFIAVLPALYRFMRHRNAYISIVSILIAILSVMTYKRNEVWSDHFSMWNDVKQKSPNKARPYNNLAIGYLEQQRNDEALVELNESLRIDPNFAEALNNRGVVWKRKGLYDMALKDLNKAVEINPGYIDAYYNRGNAYHYSGRYKQALESFARVLQINANFTEAYNELGIVYKKMRQYDKAIAMYNEALKRVPTYGDAIYNRGNVYYLKKDFKRAYEDFTKAIAYKKNFVEAYNQRGVVLRLLGKNEAALKDFTRAIKINNRNVTSYYNRAKVYAALGRLDEAVIDLTQALSINPRLKEAYNDRGIVYKKRKQYQQAIEDFTKALSIDPKYVDVLNNRGNAYTGLGKYDLALADYNRAIEINPQFATSYYNKGLIMDAKGAFKESLALYDKAISLNPNIAIMYWKRGNAYRSLEEFEKAKVDVRKAQSMGFKVGHVYFKKLENAMTRKAQENEQLVSDDQNEIKIIDDKKK